MHDCNKDELLIRIEHMTKSFHEQVILKDINLEIYKGEVVSILGPSGCGKSTLLRSINLLERPDSGKIIFEGTNLLEKGTDINQIRQKIGMVFQQFNLFPNMTVLENLKLAPMKCKGISEAEATAQAEKLLNRVGLSEKANVYPSNLSGGQKQRIAIARTLAMNPDVILFDEPTSALDPEMVGEVLSLMKELANEGMTMIIVTHEMAFAKDVSSRILFIDEQKVCVDKEAKAFFENPENERLKDFLSRFTQTTVC